MLLERLRVLLSGQHHQIDGGTFNIRPPQDLLCGVGYSALVNLSGRFLSNDHDVDVRTVGPAFTGPGAKQDHTLRVDEVMNLLGDRYGPGIMTQVDAYRCDVWGSGHLCFWGEHNSSKLSRSRSSPAPLLDAGPSVAEGDRPVEHRRIRRGVAVFYEVADTLELQRLIVR